LLLTGKKWPVIYEIDLYKKIVYDLKRDKKLSDYFSDLRKNAKISINKKYLKEK